MIVPGNMEIPENSKFHWGFLQYRSCKTGGIGCSHDQTWHSKTSLCMNLSSHTGDPGQRSCNPGVWIHKLIINRLLRTAGI